MQKLSIAELEEKLQYQFRRVELLQQALTHSSHAYEAGPNFQDNESLEFLGDSVLGFITSCNLYQRFPEYSEGQLSKTRAHLVSARHLMEVARRMNLADYLVLGRGEENGGGRHRAGLVGDALEAVVAAIYLDAGLGEASRFVVQNIIEPELERIGNRPEGDPILHDFKSALQESMQASGRPQPSYAVVREKGPDHRKTFLVEVRVYSPENLQQPEYVGRAEGPTKKNAEQRAAQSACEYLEAQHIALGNAAASTASSGTPTV